MYFYRNRVLNLKPVVDNSEGHMITIIGFELNHSFELDSKKCNFYDKFTTLKTSKQHLHVVAKTSTKRSKSHDLSIHTSSTL